MTLAVVNETNLEAILQAVHDIGLTAVNASGITPTVPAGSSKIGEIPLPSELANGLPFFAVRNPKFLGYSDFSGGISPGPEYAREMGRREMVWNFQVRVIWDYANANQHYADVRTVLRKLEAAYQKYDDLPDANGRTCEECAPHSFDWDYMNIGGKDYLYAELFVAAREVQLAQRYP